MSTARLLLYVFVVLFIVVLGIVLGVLLINPSYLINLRYSVFPQLGQERTLEIDTAINEATVDCKPELLDEKDSLPHSHSLSLFQELDKDVIFDDDENTYTSHSGKKMFTMKIRLSDGQLDDSYCQIVAIQDTDRVGRLAYEDKFGKIAVVYIKPTKVRR